VITIKRTLLRASLPIILALCLFLSSCTSLPWGPAAEQARFQEFLNRAFVAAVTVDSVTLYGLIKDPAAFGIVDHELIMPTADFPTDDKIGEERQRIAELQTFDRAKLTPAQQKDYDVLAYQAELFEPSLQYYHYADPLLNDMGIHALLPIVLAIFQFTDSADVENYLTLLDQVDEVFDSAIRFEQDRAAQGRFMTDAQVAHVIDGCQSFLSDPDNNVLLTSFAERLDAIGSIDETAKASYLARNRSLFEGTVVPSYERLIAALDALKGTGKDHARWDDPEQRRAYYAHVLNRIGITWTPSDLITILDTKLAALISERSDLRKTLAAEPSPTESFIPAMSPKEAMAFWTATVGNDFPALPDGIEARSPRLQRA